ncbi:adenine phosphoribosyltransferase [bacterium]|nr:adenine phosphoribosyltransferase [bacterium]
MKKLIKIRRYKNEKHYEVNIDGLKRLCPLYKVAPETWIVGNEHISFGTDIEFTQKIGRKLAEKISKFKADCILTAEAKSLGAAYEVARNLGHKNFAIARKSIKPYDKNYISTEIKSITSAKKELLYLDDFNIARIRGKKIVLFDDVISTCSTMLGLIELAKKAGAEVCAMAAIWLEGSLVFEQFIEEFKAGRLIHIDILPIFTIGKTYDKLRNKNISIERLLERRR